MKTLARSLRAFVKVAELGSFAAAARDLGVASSSVTRLISRAEADLGAPLLLRTTRQVRLSPVGVRALPEARRALEAIDRFPDRS